MPTLLPPGFTAVAPGTRCEPAQAWPACLMAPGMPRRRQQSRISSAAHASAPPLALLSSCSCEALELCSPGSASAAGTWAPPGTCILSTDLQMSAGRLAYLFMSGPTVAWFGGYLDPEAAVPPSPPPAGGTSGGDSGGGCPAGFVDCGQGCTDVLNDAQVCEAEGGGQWVRKMSIHAWRALGSTLGRRAQRLWPRLACRTAAGAARCVARDAVAPWGNAAAM